MKPGEITIVPPRGPVRGTVRIPSSKSLTNRALALASLASGRSTIEAPLLADDTVRMVRALRAMGVRIEPFGADRPAIEAALGAGGGSTPGGGAQRNRAWGEELGPGSGLEVSGCQGRFRARAEPLDVGGAGTAMRFLTALSALADGEVVIDGDARMRERPIEPLLEGLRSLGIEARSIHGTGSPPVRVVGGTLEGGVARLPGNVSSQFPSALLMIAPLASGPVTIEVLHPIVSRPYLDLTLRMMEIFGHSAEAAAAPQSSASDRFEFRGRGAYREAAFRVPPDASSASYFLAAAALTAGRVQVPGLRSFDPQGDLALLDHLRGMGCGVEEDEGGITLIGAGRGRLRAFDLDLGATPDLVPTLAVLALFADGPSELRNVANLRLKESDRLRALATELRRMGARVEEREDGLRITPAPLRGARIETYRDHRIAMSFAVAGLAVPGVTVTDPECVAKSFPGFWTALERLLGRPAGESGEPPSFNPTL